jgi:hypothetical protein
MAHLAQRLVDDSVLRDDVTVEQASVVLWVLCSFETFDALYAGRGKSLDEAIEMITWSAEHARAAAAGKKSSIGAAAEFASKVSPMTGVVGLVNLLSDGVSNVQRAIRKT